MSNTYSIEDLWNMAFRSAQMPLRVNDVFEGSDGAKTMLELHSQTRDELIVANDWSFARRTLALTLLKGPPPPGGYTPAQPWTPIYPRPSFLYEYVYPADCLDVRAIFAPPLGPLPDLDPVPALWDVDDDPLPNVSGVPPVASGPEAKVILCNLAGAQMNYLAQVTNVTFWPPLFVTAFVVALGRKAAKAFGAAPQQEQIEDQEAAAAAALSSRVRG